MQLEGVRPDVVTYVCILKSCASIGAINHGEGLHSKIALCDGLMENVIIINTLLHMYAKCGSLIKAQDVFAKAPIQNVVSWNALISGYAEYDYGDEALQCFEHVASQGMNPNNATYIFGLKACASVGATSKGQAIHADIERKGCFGRDLAVDSALVDMYAKSGMLAAAQRVFDEIPIRGTVLWNSMIAGYARGGSNESIFHSFHKMLEEGANPDLVTFLNLLRACSQSGMSEKSLTFFEAMSRDFGMLPDLKHHTCRLHLLGRVGHFDGVANLIAGLPFSPDRALWQSVLGACAMSGNAKLGMHAFKHTR
jgi:pentatricopeptide repeat protein